MTPRMLAGIFSGVLSAGAMLLPAETAARPGGMAPGPAAMPAMRAPPPMVRPAMQGRIAPLARTGHPHPGQFLRDHHRRFPGAALAGWWPPMSYADSYDGAGAYSAVPDNSLPPYSSSSPAPVAPAPTPVVQSVTRIIVLRGGCESNAETIPWRDGSLRTITMVRC